MRPAITLTEDELKEITLWVLAGADDWMTIEEIEQVVRPVAAWRKDLKLQLAILALLQSGDIAIGGLNEDGTDFELKLPASRPVQ